MNRRTEKLASTLQRALQEVLAKGLHDPRYRGLVTITGVHLTDDLKKADIGVSVLPEKQQGLTIHALQDASRHIRREVGDIVAMHEVPELVFKLDTSLKQQARVFEALNRAAASRPPADPSAAESDHVDQHHPEEPGDAGTQEANR